MHVLGYKRAHLSGDLGPVLVAGQAGKASGGRVLGAQPMHKQGFPDIHQSGLVPAPLVK